MKKILAMLGTLSLAVSASSTVIACYDNTTSEEAPKKASLSEVIDKTELGHFEYRPTGQQILAKLKDLHNDLEIKEINVVEISDDLGQAKISVIPNSEIYEISTLTLTFTVKKWSKINEVILETNLGDFTKIPTEDELKTRLVEIEENKSLELDQIELFKIDSQDQVLKQAIVLVKEDSTIYSAGRVVVSYKLNLVDLKQIIQDRNLGTFLPDAEASAFLEAVKEKNNDLDLNEVVLEKDPTNPNVATIKVKPESLTYFQNEVKVNYFVDQTIGFNQIIETRAKALILSDQYGVSENLIYKQMRKNDLSIPNGIDKYFAKNPFKEIEADENKNVNITGAVGEVGGILSLIKQINRDTKVPFDFDSILGNTGEVSEDINSDDSKTAFSTISQIINVGLEILSTFEFIFAFELLPILGPILGDLVPMGTFSEIKDGFNEFLKNDLKKEKIQPILEGFKKGSNLTDLVNKKDKDGNELTLINFQSAIIFSLFNTIGFGLEQNYQEINVVDQTVEPNKYNVAVKKFAKWLPNFGKKNANGESILKFNFMLNPGKIFENLLMTINILNHILTEYKTPHIDLSTHPEGAKDKETRSQYIFSNTVLNNEYIKAKSRKYVKEVKTNWNGFNLAELISNIRYYFGADKSILKYRLQQLSYILLSSGDSYAPLSHFLYEFVFEQTWSSVPSGIRWLPGLKSNVQDAINGILYEHSIHKLINNWKIQVQEIKNKPFIWAAANEQLGRKFIRGPNDFLAAIDNWFSNGINSFDALYTKNLKTLFSENALYRITEAKNAFIGIRKMLDKLVGPEPEKAVSLEDIFTKFNVADILNAYGVETFENPNIPNYGSAYLDKTGWDLIHEISDGFKINGDETSEGLKNFNFNFELLADIINEFLYKANGKDTGWLVQTLDLLEGYYTGETREKDILEFFGFDEELETLKQDSFFGRLVKFLYPELQDSLTADEPINLRTGLKDLNNTYQWLVNGLISHAERLTRAENIKDFTQAVIDAENAYTVIETTNLRDDNQLSTGITMLIEYDPTKVIFSDGTSLAGEVIRYLIVVERKTIKDEFIFKSITNITKQEKEKKEKEKPKDK